jgi:hypothetical protein
VASIAINSAGTGCTGNGNFTVSAPNISGGATAGGSYTCSGGALATVTLGGKGSGYTSAPTYTPATGDGTVTVTMNGSSTAPGTGYQALSMLVGDPVAITRCNSTTAFNNVTTTSINGHTIPNQRGPLATTGSTAWTGSPVAGNLTVSYPSTVNGSDNGGFCALNVEQGGPSGLVVQHFTEINDSLGYSIGSNASPSSGYNFSTGAAIVDSLLLGAGLGQSALAEGTQSTGYLYDTSTLSLHHSVFPTRTASSYTEYGNNPNFTDSAGCTGTGCHNPATLYFPTAPWATGATCGPTNVCFKGSAYKNASSLVLAPADYHDFVLDPSSVFKATGSQSASDGKDMGANIPAIDAAQTLNQYVCGTSCGSLGPYPDE